MEIGRVKWLNDAKSIALIAPHLGGEDHLVHLSAVAGNRFKNLKEGQTVTFEIITGASGKQVGNIEPYSAWLEKLVGVSLQSSDDKGIDDQ